MNDITYARARLWTGITGVGGVVVLVSGLLLTGTPASALSGVGGSFAEDARVLFGLLFALALLGLPFDVLGGLLLPRRFGRSAPRTGAFVLRWLRGVFVLVSLSSLCGTLLLAAGRLGGRPAALITLTGLGLALLALQEPLARLVGGLVRAESSGADASRPVLYLRGSDPAFCGGFTGLSANLVVSERWRRMLPREQLDLLLERRERILRSGAWTRSLVLAVGWNVLGFWLASLLPNAGVTTVGELVTTSLGFTLWTFVGLLLLPTPSRAATIAADERAVGEEPLRRLLGKAVRQLDRLQDDEPERAPGLEAVFHPVPAVENRFAERSGPARGPGAWHLARTSLFVSHAGLSLLPRLVHCNVGRPELWVYLPTDG